MVRQGNRVTTDPGFPENIVLALSDYFTATFIGPDATQQGIAAIVRRRLRPTDPTGTLAIFADTKQPDEYEMKGEVVSDPSIAHYALRLDFFIKHTDEDEGRAIVARITKIIWVLLYRDPALIVRLRSLVETLFDVTESTLRWRIDMQKYFDTQLASTSTYALISTTQLRYDTQS